MPLRGESVGTAYIRLIADGTGIPGDIEDALDEAHGHFDDAGSRDAKAYKKSFAEEIKKHDEKSLSKALNNAFVKDDAIEEFFGSSRWNKTVHNLEARFGRLGTDAAEQMKEKFTKAGSLDGIENEIERVVARINANVERENKKRLDEEEAFQKRFRSIMIETSRMQIHAEEERRGALEDTRRTLESFHPVLASYAQDLRKAESDLGRFKTQTRDTDHAATRFAQTIDRMAGSIARGFGKGSRNDFINFFGSFVGNSVRLVGLLPRVVGNLQEFADGFKLAGEEGEKGLKRISAGLDTMAKDAEGGQTAIASLLETGLPGFLLLATALIALPAILGPIAALISGIAAALVAMTSTIAFGLVGALVPLVGLVGPIGFAILGVVAAIATLDKQTKKTLTHTLKPFVDGFKELGKQVREGFTSALDEGTRGGAFDRLVKSLHNLDGLFFSIGQGLGNFASHFVHFLNSSGFDAFQARMSLEIPHALDMLGRAVRNTLAALSNLFLDANPQANTFLGWLVKITREFRRFVHDNPDKIQTFFENAAESAKQIGDFLAAAGRVLGDLFFSKSGKKQGDSLFGSMTDALNRFDRFLDKHPDALHEFFKNGGDVARQIGDIAVGVGKIIDTLDSPAARKALHIILELANSFIGIANTFAAQLEIPLAIISTFIGAIGKIPRVLSRAKTAIGNFFSHLAGLGGGRGGSALLIKPPNLSWIPGMVSRIVGAFGTVRDRAGAIFSAAGDRIAALMRSAASRVGGFFSGIPDRLRGLTDNIVGAVQGWATGILNALRKVPGEILNIFAGLGAMISNVIGSIHINWPSPPGWLSKLSPGLFALNQLTTASGGVFDRASMRIIGEAGPEAVVPLSGPLSNVDPAVRELSMIARGLLGTAPVAAVPASPTTPGTGKSITNHWQITTLTPDTVGVATELLNRMTASAY